VTQETRGQPANIGGTARLTLLFFGMSSPDGSGVSEQEWQAFQDDVLTARFAAGFTILQASGQYLPADGGLVREGTRIVLLVHDGGERTLDDIAHVIREYCRRFRQDSVLQVTADVTPN
jgi:hypothetical protein